MSLHEPLRLLALVGTVGGILTACHWDQEGIEQPLRPEPWVAQLAVPPPEDKLSPSLAARLDDAAPTEHFIVLVDLSRQVDAPVLASRVRDASGSKEERRQRVVQAFETTAKRQQRNVLSALDEIPRGDSIAWIRRVAIVNRLIVKGTEAAIRRLTVLPQVARIRLERRSGWGSPGDPGLTPFKGVANWDNPAIQAMGVPALWRQGLDGTGIVVAAIDTGVTGDHEQLQGRRLPAPRGWFDAVGGAPEPGDSHGHGTAVLSMAVGSNPEGRVVGVAPGASWAMGRAHWRNHYSRVRTTLAADWILRVAQPDVLINAWSHPDAECESFDAAFISAWRAAEILPVFAIGNAARENDLRKLPGALSPNGRAVFAVSALDGSGALASFSPRGPAPCGLEPLPTLAAPGEGVLHAWPGEPRYARSSGTSAAAAYAAGAAALLLQANPELSPEQVGELLRESARELVEADASRRAVKTLFLDGDLVQAAQQMPTNEDSGADRSTIRFLPAGKDYRLVMNDRDFHIPADWLSGDEGGGSSYVSDDQFEREVISFPIGSGYLGLRLSSYAIQREGSARAAAGRDVFLVYSEKEDDIEQGLTSLGITRQRGRFAGCWNARSVEFFAKDVNGDDLADIGIRRKAIRCTRAGAIGGSNDDHGPCFERYPVEWWLFDQGRWVASEGTFPVKRLEDYRIDVPGNLGSPVEFVRQGMSQIHSCSGQENATW